MGVYVSAWTSGPVVVLRIDSSKETIVAPLPLARKEKGTRTNSLVNGHSTRTSMNKNQSDLDQAKVALLGHDGVGRRSMQFGM